MQVIEVLLIAKISKCDLGRFGTFWYFGLQLKYLSCDRFKMLKYIVLTERNNSVL